MTQGGIYDANSAASVQATANTGYRFDHWTVNGANAGATNPLSVTMDGDKSVTAVFVRLFALTINGAGGGSVRVNNTPRKLPWTAQIAEGTSVTVIAVPDADWQFTGWTGDITGMQNPVTFTVNAAMTITAHFSQVSTYLVGDVAPNFPGYFGLGEFGDEILNADDIATAMLRWSTFDLDPPTGTVMFDAMDSYPVDTRRSRGGDGQITWGDIITTNDRSMNPSLPRPRRTALPGGSLVTLIAAPTSPQSLNIANGLVLQGGTTWLPVTLQLGKKNADRFGFCIDLLHEAGVPDATILGFIPAAALPNPSFAESYGSTQGVAWLDPLPSVKGTVLLGYIQVQVPSDAPIGSFWTVDCTAAGASAGSTELPLLKGDGSLNVVATLPHDVAVTAFTTPSRSRVDANVNLTATVTNQTTTLEQDVVVTVRLQRANGDTFALPSQTITLGGMSSVQVSFSYVCSSADIPSIVLTAEAVVAGDTNTSNNLSPSRTVVVR